MRRATFPARGATLFAVVSLAACSSGSGVVTVPPPPPPLRIVVDGVPGQIPPGSTVGDAVRLFGLHPRAGDLLSVSGDVLEPRVDPGRIVLDGRRTGLTTPLREGDRLSVVDGRDRVEPTRRIVRDAGVRVGDPERTLDVYPTTVVSVVGRISQQTASVEVRSHGDGHAPREVALTFDDGPWPNSTRRILAILRRFHVHATFFMVGAQADRYPDLVRRVAAGGHEIGNHSFDHPITLRSASSATLTDELARTNTTLSRDGVTPTLFRPPGGWYDDQLVQEARRQGMRLVTWSVDPDDWKSGVPWTQIRDTVLGNVRPGSIVLLHDGGGDAGHTIRALPSIIRGIRAKGLRLVVVPARPV